MPNRYEVLEINDDKDYCECCGKTGLTRVVWIEDNETGIVKHFGTTCAKSPDKGFGINREIDNFIRRYDRDQKQLIRRAMKLIPNEYKKFHPDGIGYDLLPEGLRVLIEKKQQLKEEDAKFYSGFKRIQ